MRDFYARQRQLEADKLFAKRGVAIIAGICLTTVLLSMLTDWLFDSRPPLQPIDSLIVEDIDQFIKNVDSEGLLDWPHYATADGLIYFYSSHEKKKDVWKYRNLVKKINLRLQDPGVPYSLRVTIATNNYVGIGRHGSFQSKITVSFKSDDPNSVMNRPWGSAGTRMMFQAPQKK